MHRRFRILREQEILVMQEIRKNPHQSYQDIAFATNFARCTVCKIIRRLTIDQYIDKTKGKGKNPNYYKIL